MSILFSEVRKILLESSILGECHNGKFAEKYSAYQLLIFYPGGIVAAEAV